jgi:P27 family predicted phage terminase small subunit
MSKGRKGTPLALKILRGNPSRKPLNLQEPKFEAGVPDKPEWFGTYASEEWDRLVGDLNGQLVFTKHDLGIIASACLAYQQVRESRAVIDQLGYSYAVEDMGGNKHFKSRPECMRFETALKEYRMLLAEMGFTPASRSKVKTLAEPPKPKGTAEFFTS